MPFQSRRPTPAYILPQPDELSKKELEGAMGAYLMTFAGLAIGAPIPFLSLLISLVYHLVNARKSRFTAFHSLQSLLSEIPVTLCNAMVVFWGIAILIGGALTDYEGLNLAPFWWCLALTILVTLSYMVISLIAAFRAQKGQFIYLWLVGPFAYNYYYVMGKGASEKAPGSNQPPPGF